MKIQATLLVDDETAGTYKAIEDIVGQGNVEHAGGIQVHLNNLTHYTNRGELMTTELVALFRRLSTIQSISFDRDPMVLASSGPDLPFQFYIPPFARSLLDAHNKHRTSPLKINWLLMQMAQMWASYMALHNEMSHGSGQTEFETRLRVSGYEYTSGGENVAAGYRDTDQVMSGWMDSPGHRANITNPDFREVGFGMAQAGPSSPIYWCTDFGRPMAAGTFGEGGLTRSGPLGSTRQ